MRSALSIFPGLAAAALAALILPAHVRAQAGSRAPQPWRTLAGVVVDATTRAPLPGVILSLEGAGRSIATDGRGRFLFRKVHDTDGPLVARQIGYASQAADIADGPDTLAIALEPDPLTLHGIEVVARRMHLPEFVGGGGFLSRRSFGLADIANARPGWTAADLLLFRGAVGAIGTGVYGYGYTALWDDLYARRRSPVVLVDNAYAFMGVADLNRLPAYELYSIDVYDHGSIVIAYTKAWMVSQARHVLGLPPLDSWLLDGAGQGPDRPPSELIGL